jgi:hypothetical protein
MQNPGKGFDQDFSRRIIRENKSLGTPIAKTNRKRTRGVAVRRQLLLQMQRGNRVRKHADLRLL